MKILDAAPTGQSLGCHIQQWQPVLNLTLRYQSGYRVTFPFSKLPEKDALLVAAFRVTEKASGKSYLFRQTFRFPPFPPKTKLQGLLDGGFFLGEGEYDVKWLLSDLKGQECRKEWSVRLKIKNKDPILANRLEPGQVSSPRLNTWLRRTERPRPYRVAILVHGAPLYPRASILSGYDISLFATTVASLLEDTPFVETSVVAFNLQKRAEIFRSEQMLPKEFLRLYDSLDELEVATVDLKNMLNRKGYLNLLAGLVNRETASATPPDAIIFIGPNNRHEDKFPEELLEGSSGTSFFYLRHAFGGRYLPFADSIEKLVKSQDGKVFNVLTPRDFANALRKIEETLDSRKAASTR